MEINTLTPADIRKLPDGKHADGKYLYLVVRGDNRSWVVRGPRDAAGKRLERGLGSVDLVSLASARRKRDDLLSQWQDGRDPLEERRRAAAAAAKRKTFAEVAEEVIKNRVGSWAVSELKKKSSTLAQWRHDLEIVCKPIAAHYIDEIALQDIKPVVMPYFDAKHDERAKGLLNRLEKVFDYAVVHEWRTAANPATSKIWKEVAPKRPKNDEGEEQHYAALPWAEVPAVFSRFRSSDALAARITEFIILTATRSQEARGAQWSEIDFERKVWTIPASRMKMRLAHEVPLSEPAIALLRRMPRAGEFVFVGGRGRLANKGTPMGHQGVWAFVQRATGQDEATVHGFRSAFKDWADNNGVDDRLSEKCLAHKETSAVKRAYARDQLTEPRRPIMEAWARFVDGADGANIIPFRSIVRGAA